MDQLPVTKIPWSSLEPGEQIGSGGFGDVYRGTWHGTPVAIKQLHLKVLSNNLIEDFQAEAQIMSRCRFPQILQLFGICLDSGHYSLVMEFMANGSLYTFLHDKKQNPDLPWSQRVLISTDICKGVSYLHSQNILHRDLKSHNVLLDQHLNAKICDFGLSKIKLESTSSKTNAAASSAVGSTRWLPPEAFKRGFKHSTTSDIYSFGMIMWEIASREIPFLDAATDFVVMGFLKDGEQEIIPDDCLPEFGEIIKKCWESTDKRPAATEIIGLLQKSAPKPPAPSIEKSWHLDSSGIKSDSNTQSSYSILDATKKDTEKAISFYQTHPVPGYEVASVKVIYNSGFDMTFNQQLKQLQTRKGNPSFAPKWSNSMSNKKHREKTIEILHSYAKPFVDPDYPDVLIVPAWHGTKPELLDSIFKAGYSNLGSTDNGYFGKGTHSTHLLVTILVFLILMVPQAIRSPFLPR